MLIDIVIQPKEKAGAGLTFGFAAEFIKDYLAAISETQKKRFLDARTEPLAGPGIFAHDWDWPQQEELECQACHLHENDCPLCGGETVLRRAKTDELIELMAFLHEIYVWFDTHDAIAGIGQAQSFDFSDRSGGIGHLYAPLLDFIRTCPEDTLLELKDSVQSWMQKAHLQIYGYEDNDVSVRVTRSSLYLGLTDSSSRSFHIPIFKEGDATVRLDPHHVDNICDQFILMMGIIALNTFYRRCQRA